MVPPYSNRISRVPLYSSSAYKPFRIQGCHLLRPLFPKRSARVYKPLWASPISLAATFGISVDFFSSGYLDVSVPRVRLTYFKHAILGLSTKWVSPFRYLRINAYLPTPRSFSQAITSFFAFYCLGIHHVRLIP